MLAAMLPRLGSSVLISTWIWITIAASIAAALSGGVMQWAALAPARIWRGEVWRLVTWVFVEPGALALILTCASIYKFGGELAPRWGDRRLRRFLLEILGGAAAATALLGLISAEVWHRQYLGGWAVCDVLVIAWARQYPDSILVVHGLRLNGRNLAAAVIAITCVYALFAGPLAMAPELLACVAAYSYPGAWLARRKP
jgi:membrane associated rhomboid family serine protease